MHSGDAVANEHSEAREGWALLSCYAAASGLYRLAGVHFDPNVLMDMHFLSFGLLRGDLLWSLFYLHAQPPLMNLLLGLALKLPAGHHALALELFYILAGAAGLYCLHGALRLLRVGRLARLAVCLPLCVLPTLFLYQCWPYSTFLEFCLCAAALYALAAFYVRPRFAPLLALFTLCSALGLLHACWHLSVFAGLAALMALMAQKGARRMIVAACVLGLLPLLAWYGKNYAVFGFFGATSWAGSNVGQVAATMMRPQQMAELKAQGMVSPDFPLLYRMDRVLRYVPPETLPAQMVHPSLLPYKYPSQPPDNFNYAGMIAAGKRDLRDGLAIIAHDPWRYGTFIGQRMAVVLRLPSLAYPLVPGLPNLMRDAGLEVTTKLPYQSLPRALRQLLSGGSVLLYGLIPASLLLMAPFASCWRRREWRPFALCCLYLAGCLSLLSFLANGFEQERMRFGLEAAYLCMAALALEMLAEAAARLRRRGRP